MSDHDKLPDGVTRRNVSAKKCDCTAGIGTRMAVTQVNGHGQVREMWWVGTATGDWSFLTSKEVAEQFVADIKDARVKGVFLVRRVIVIETEEDKP